MQAPEGTLISYATQPGNVAQDGSDGHSPYTKALAQVIRLPGLDVFQTFNQVGLAVKRATGGVQQPWLSSSPIDGAFYFVASAIPQGTETIMPKSQSIGDKAAAPLPSTVPAPSQASSTDPAAEAWAAAKDTASIGVLEAFVSKFGQSFYAELARARIADLKTQQEQKKLADVAPKEPSAFVAPVLGAPGDGTASLTAAMKKRLYAKGVKLTSVQSENTYTVKGIISLKDASGGKQSIRIDWQVIDPRGKRVGTVSQQNTIPWGSLNGSWGLIAGAAAGAAAEGIIKLLHLKPTTLGS